MIPPFVHLHWPDVRLEHLAATPGHVVLVAGHEGSKLTGQARITLDAEQAAKLGADLARMAQEAVRRKQAADAARFPNHGVAHD